MDLEDVPIDIRLVHGCWKEAERADFVVASIESLRTVLDEKYHGHMLALMEEICSTSRLLRTLADLSRNHFNRVPTVVNYLGILLPCLCRTLRDITGYCEDRTLSRETRWRTLYHKMTTEANGLPLPQRFVLYNRFLVLLRELLLGYVDRPTAFGCL